MFVSISFEMRQKPYFSYDFSYPKKQIASSYDTLKFFSINIRIIP